MAWEWVAPTATAVVALGGIAATWLTARGGRESQERLQVAQHDETRKLTMRNERRQAYAEFAGEIRDWLIRSSLQGFLTSVIKGETLESREATRKVLSDMGVGITVDEALALPEVVAAVAAKRVGSVTQLAGTRWMPFGPGLRNPVRLGARSGILRLCTGMRGKE
jgi:hypothetical protein